VSLEMNEDQLQEFCHNVSELTRENYNLPGFRLRSTGRRPLPRPSLARGLQTVLERWNRQFGRAVVGVGVAFAARRLARLRASAAVTVEAERVSCIEILGVRVGRPETVEKVAGSHDAQGALRTVKHYSTIVMVAYLCKADYALHTEKIWKGTTLRKGCLTSQDLSRQVLCTMDVDFSSREVWCPPILKRGLSSGKCS
jgi:hypothetical protein